MQPALPRSESLQRLTLPESSRHDWLQDAANLGFPDARDLPAWRAFVAESVRLAEQHLPVDAERALGRFFSENGPEVLLIENLPVDVALPPPPRDGRRPPSKSAVSEAVITGLIERYASILAYTNEKCGAPIHEIAPAAGMESVPSSVGRVPFAYHTDIAFLAPRFSPRGLLLFGLLNQNGAPTTVLPLARLLEAAPAGLLRSLKKRIFRHPAPATFEMPVSVVAPILWTDDTGQTRIAVQTHAVQALNEEARIAIAQLKGLLDRVEPERVVLAPGAAVLFRNDRVLHGRDAFTGERWLQRTYFTDSSAPFLEHTGSSPGAFAFDARLLLEEPFFQKGVAPPEPISHSKN